MPVTICRRATTRSSSRPVISAHAPARDGCNGPDVDRARDPQGRQLSWWADEPGERRRPTTRRPNRADRDRFRDRPPIVMEKTMRTNASGYVDGGHRRHACSARGGAWAGGERPCKPVFDAMLKETTTPHHTRSRPSPVSRSRVDLHR